MLAILELQLDIIKLRLLLEEWNDRYEDLKEENEKLRKECDENDYLVEDNARWMKECGEKTMEIKKLKSDLAYERTMLDNVRAEYESLQNVIKKLREDNDKLQTGPYKYSYVKKLQKQNEKLEEKNKNLNKELELVRKNTRANVETLDNMYGELVDLKKENK